MGPAPFSGRDDAPPLGVLRVGLGGGPNRGGRRPLLYGLSPTFVGEQGGQDEEGRVVVILASVISSPPSTKLIVWSRHLDSPITG